MTTQLPRLLNSWRLYASISALLMAGLTITWFCLALSVRTRPASAATLATFYVDGAAGNDANACTGTGASACATIGGAISKANAGDTIEIAAGTYQEHDLDFFDLTLIGADPETTIIDANFQGRGVYVRGDSALTNLTIMNGHLDDEAIIFDDGGAGLISNGDVTLQNVILTNNFAAGNGGAIFTLGHLTIDQTLIYSNTALGNGGGVYQYGLGKGETITLTGSILRDNTAQGAFGGGAYITDKLVTEDTAIRDNTSASFGGGLYFNDTHAEPSSISRTEISGNQSTAAGGAFASAGTIEFNNVTIAENIATSNYAGLYVSGPDVDITINTTTIANNDRLSTTGVSYGGLSVSNNATASIQNSLIADNDGRNCSGSGEILSQGFNISSDNRCPFTGTMDLQVTDPLLGTLGDYSGSTRTVPLLSGSPAIDAGDNGSCGSVDQRGIARPFDGDSNGTATCDIGAFEVTSQISIEDLDVDEGNSGTNAAIFTVTLSPTSTETVTLFASTVAGTASAGSDFTAISNQQITFNPGESIQTVTVDVVGDTDDEADEQFTVALSNPTHAIILDGEATGTIVDDDGLPSLTLTDVTIDEGTSTAEFTVTLSPASLEPVTVNAATANGTATAGDDYTAVNQDLIFTAGQTEKTVQVPILSDMIDEGTLELFTVNLSGATNATIVDGTGNGTITDDDTASIRHELGPQVAEGDTGTTSATFTATLSTPAAFVVTVDYEVSALGISDAHADLSDFTGPMSGTLTFNPGETEKTYSVQIVGDTAVENDERFSSLLTNANPTMTISPNGSNGTILNDDSVVNDPLPNKVMLPMIVR